jgi:signal transduction histidine kinase/CheY-like chemotaxis protein
VSDVRALGGPGRILLAAAIGWFVVSLLALLVTPLALTFDDLQELIAAGGGALALALAARRDEGPGRRASLAMAASLAAAWAGMAIWDVVDTLGQGLPAAGNALFVGGAGLGTATIVWKIFGAIPRDRIVGVAIDTLIVFLTGIAVVASLWQQGAISTQDHTASVGAVLLVSAAAASAFGLFSRRVGWSTPGPWALLLGAFMLGSGWLVWASGIASTARLDPSDFVFSAGLLLITAGALGWDTRPTSGEAYERLSTVLGSLLPVAAIFVSLGLFAFSRGSDFSGLLGLAASAVIVTSAVRQLHLFVREARARNAVATRTAQLQAALGALEQEIAERHRLETEREAMQIRMAESQRLESVGRLAGGVAHDFNNLLTVIRGHAELTALRLPDGDEGHEDVAGILHAADRAADLVAQLLAFSRNQRLEPSVVDLSDVVRAAEPLLRRLIGERVELSVRTERDLLPVLADASQIESIVVNLAVNARDAMESGGRLTIETANVELAEGLALGLTDVPPGPYALLEVSDTGIGMDEETISRIFEPFFSTKGTGKGNGLGLAVVYGTVRQSGGFIGVSSQPGEGTTFRIYLPPVAERTAEPAAPLPAVRPAAPRRTRTRREAATRTGAGPVAAATGPAAAGPGPAAGPAAAADTVAGARPRTILVVEDEAPVRTVIASALQRWGYAVVAVGNGDEALAAIEGDARFGVLLTDVVMPGRSGLELADQVRVLVPDIQVVCMSGYTPPDLDRNLDPRLRFMAKPFTLSKLRQLMRDVLGEDGERVRR